MKAFVMSGGANFAAMQASALAVLVEGGFKPDIVVGTSAGALNCLYLAANPIKSGTEELINNWRLVGSKEVGMPKLLPTLLRLITGKSSLIPSEALADFLRKRFPPEMETFGQLHKLHGIRAYTVAVCMETGETVVFGDRLEDRVIDGAMASVSVPPFFPPWVVGNYHYLDGGITSKLPIQIAIEREATEIVALDIYSVMGSLGTDRNMLSISGYALSLIMEDQTRREIEAAKLGGVSLRVITLVPPADIRFWDYHQVDRLIEAGREQTRLALEEEPLQFGSKWRIRVRRSIASMLQKRLV